MLLTSQDYRESLRRLKPRVFVDGRRIESIADDPALAPGVAAIGLAYDLAREPENRTLMVAREGSSGREVDRMLHIDRTSTDLLYKLEATRMLCQRTGCAQRYLTHDAFNALYQATARVDQDCDTAYEDRFLAYMHRVQDADLTCGVAMTDAKGDRSKRPHEQMVPDTHVRIVKRTPKGIVISGTKAIVTGAPYVHEFLVLPGRAMTKEDADFAVACAVPLDAEGVTIVARPAGRPGQSAAKFSARYGQSTGVVLFDEVVVPWERVFLAGEWQHAHFLANTYATHHRHTCVGARAGFGDLLIGAGVMMTEANGLDAEAMPHIRDAMVELIKVVEGFFACGVAASLYAVADDAGNVQPDPVFANVGKLLLSTQIYDMQRLAHYVSGGLIVALPGPDEDHNPETAGKLSEVLAGRADVPAAHRLEVARLVEDLTASYTGGWYSLISLHGGGSPEAMKREIYRSYPLQDRRELVARLLDRGVLAGDPAHARDRQPGRCCATGCEVPKPASRARKKNPPAKPARKPRRPQAAE